MEVDDLIADLTSVRERIDSLMFDLLRDASSTGQGRPDADKDLLKVARSLDKSVHILKSLRGR